MTALSKITAQLLRDASFPPGARVLDIGCGPGEVTRAVALLVGPQGRVIGLDSSAAAIDAANIATREAGLENVEYICADLSDARFDPHRFDGIVGRRVLMYLPDPRAVLTELVRILRPGGAMAFQEHDRTITPGRIGEWPLHDLVHGWMWKTVEREGANPNLGLALPGLLEEAGMSVEAVTPFAVAAGYEQGVHHSLHVVVKAMLPRIVAMGVASEAEVDIATLESRLDAERRAHRTSYISDLAVCVVGRRPALP